MCGIAGAAWSQEAPPIDLATLERMTTVLAHRGPDDAGYYHSIQAPHGTGSDLPTTESVVPSTMPGGGQGVGALGHRRLSIIDLAGGHQPLSNEDGTVWIAFNGEIYNYQELQRSLENQGHRFRTSSDTETIVHLYEEYGTECVHRLRGMFAFAIWDARRGEMFLARDRVGKKPLVYRADRGQLLFGSELKALLQVPDIPRELDLTSLDQYLTYQYVPHPRSILKGFSKLSPAHWALFRDGKLELRRYWRPGFEEDETSSDGAPSNVSRAPDRVAPSEARGDLRKLLTEAVRLRMRSDVPLGAFLSGGIDSTIITGLMQELSSRPVQTFSIGFSVAAFDERSFAREAARHLKTEHHEFVVEPAALEILPRLIWHYDEPFADSSAIPTMYLAEMTRKHVTVALSGDGGDELFAGYDRYRAVRLGDRFDRLPALFRNALTAQCWQRLPASTRQKSSRRRLKRLLSALAYPPERRYLKWVSIFDDARRTTLYSDGIAAALSGLDPADFLLDAYRECPRRDFVTRTTAADFLTYLPCDILTKVDIATMAYGLEARCPFLDQELVRFAAKMPIDWKLRGSRGKRILTETFGDLVPPSLVGRPKMGFGVPLDHWFRNELKDLLCDSLLSRKSLERGLFRRETIEGLVHEHTTGRWDHSYRLWSLLVLEQWQQKFLD
jgi:asparagine synthase (glutamine-hydrolysing)